MNTVLQYYAAYNISAALSLLASKQESRQVNNLDAALTWLRIAYQINPEVIGPLMADDSDLDFLKQERRAEYFQILTGN